MTIYGMDARSTGFTIDELKSLVRPDQIRVYSGSAMGQLDQDGYVIDANASPANANLKIAWVWRNAGDSSMPMFWVPWEKPPASSAPAPPFCTTSNAAWTKYAAAANASSSWAMRKRQ